MKLRVILFPALAALSLLACRASPPVRYHTLSTPGITDTAPMPPAPFAIEVLPVGVPAQWDIPQVVIHTNQDSVILLENDRWLSSLSDEMQTALSQQLVQRLGAQDAFGLTPPTRPVVRIRVQIRRFESWPGHAVYLDADWGLSTRQGDQQRKQLCTTHLTAPATGDQAHLFSAWQTVTGQLAEQISHTTQAWMQDHDSHCRT